MDNEDELGLTQYGLIVTCTLASDHESRAVAQSLQRFLSAIAIEYDQPAKDVHYGGRPVPSSGALVEPPEPPTLQAA